MQHQLINHSEDLKRLVEEGFEVEVREGYLIIHAVPYVDRNKEVKLGKLVAQLNLIGNRTTRPKTHVIYFTGDAPCNKDGSVITGIVHSSQNNAIFEDIVLKYSFSNKPKNGYEDYYHQVTQYVDIICAPAKALDKKATAQTFKTVKSEDEVMFKYSDTNASRANITHLNAKFKPLKVAIVGLGGTGSYLLDFIAKTPVAEIHLFDGDRLLQHNSFRSPGVVKPSDFGKMKTDYYQRVYSTMHNGIVSHPYFVLAENIHELHGMDMVFLCVDNGEARQMMVYDLPSKGVSFLDIGLGLQLVNDSLIGTVRVTLGDAEHMDHFERRIPFGEDGNNAYANNIQMAELNCLGAVMAVEKWKKLVGFYQDLVQEYHTTYSLNVSQLCNDEVDEDDNATAA
jgi:hypothetical protein